jgi:hypothetical protein
VDKESEDMNPEDEEDEENATIDESVRFGSYGTVYEDDYDPDPIHMIANAIIRRILGNVKQHSELIIKAGPDGVMNRYT